MKEGIVVKRILHFLKPPLWASAVHISLFLFLISFTPDRPPTSSFRLQLLHFSDIDGNLHKAMDNAEHFAFLVHHFRSQYPRETLLLSSGDNFIPSTLYDASAQDPMTPILGIPGPGRAFIALLNALGTTASAVGNHELDRGIEEFVGVIGVEERGTARYPGAAFPFLSANIDFSLNPHSAPLLVAGGQGLAPARLAPSAVVTIGGERIGLIGAATPHFSNITGGGDSLTVYPQKFDSREEKSWVHLATTLQAEVDNLRDLGINKIILLSHMQELSVERALATGLRGVDIIVAGGSGTLLADTNDRLKENDHPLHDYPLIFMSPDNEPVLLVNSSGDLHYLGRLLVDFDTHGRILHPHNLDSISNGIYLADATFLPKYIPSTPELKTMLSRVSSIVGALDESLRIEKTNAEVVGRTRVALEGRRTKIRREETNLGSLVADAALWAFPSADVGLINSGGIRSSIGETGQFEGGSEVEITFLDVKNVLPFNNKLAVVSVSALEMVTILEHALSASGPGDADPPGQFPQVAGLRLIFDTTQKGLQWQDTNNCAHESNPAFGTASRIRSLIIEKDSAFDVVVKDGEFQGNPHRTFTLVTPDFIAEGGDNFPFPCLDRPSPIEISERGQQEGLAKYLKKHFLETPFNVPERDSAQDTRLRRPL